MPNQSTLKDHAVEDHDDSQEQFVRVEAPLPQGATPIRGPNKYVSLYEISTHSKIKGPHGRIILAVYDWGKDAMTEHFRHTAKFSPPSSRAEGVGQGEQSVSCR